MKKIINYIKDSYNELVHKVSWPSRAELTNSAVIVMIASIIMALVVWGCRFGVRKLDQESFLRSLIFIKSYD